MNVTTRQSDKPAAVSAMSSGGYREINNPQPELHHDRVTLWNSTPRPV